MKLRNQTLYYSGSASQVVDPKARKVAPNRAQSRCARGGPKNRPQFMGRRILTALQELVYTHIIIRRMNKQHLWNAYNMRIRNGQCDSEITVALAREIDRRMQLRGSAC